MPPLAKLQRRRRQNYGARFGPHTCGELWRGNWTGMGMIQMRVNTAVRKLRRNAARFGRQQTRPYLISLLS
jgi:hypothetical protein